MYNAVWHIDLYSNIECSSISSSLECLSWEYENKKRKEKGKAIPVTGRGGP
jgi:hypothetical protein